MAAPNAKEPVTDAPTPLHQRSIGLPFAFIMLLAGVLGYSALNTAYENDNLKQELRQEQVRNETTGQTIDRLRNFNGR